MAYCPQCACQTHGDPPICGNNLCPRFGEPIAAEENSAVQPCPDCGVKIPTEAKTCPHCGTPKSMLRSICTGVLITILGAFPVAALVALFFRFPVPFDGYRSGISAVVPAIGAVLFYGIVGGFVVLAVLGAIAGAGAHSISSEYKKPVTPILVGFALIADLSVTLVLAMLDKIIGRF
jgi:hypothetical protein